MLFVDRCVLHCKIFVDCFVCVAATFIDLSSLLARLHVCVCMWMPSGCLFCYDCDSNSVLNHCWCQDGNELFAQAQVAITPANSMFNSFVCKIISIFFLSSIRQGPIAAWFSRWACFGQKFKCQAPSIARHGRNQNFRGGVLQIFRSSVDSRPCEYTFVHCTCTWPIYRWQARLGEMLASSLFLYMAAVMCARLYPVKILKLMLSAASAHPACSAVKRIPHILCTCALTALSGNSIECPCIVVMHPWHGRVISCRQGIN